MRYFAKPSSTFLTVVVAAAVIAVVGGGSAVAGSLVTSAKIKNNTIQSIDVKNNALTGTDVRTGSLTGADLADRSLSNNDISVYYATVSATGVVIDSSGGVTADNAEIGRYSVKFPRDIHRCAFTATIGDTGLDAFGEITAFPLNNGPEGVHVETSLPDGLTGVNRPFNVMVVC